jgi:hypothetical protein
MNSNACQANMVFLVFGLDLVTDDAEAAGVRNNLRKPMGALRRGSRSGPALDPGRPSMLEGRRWQGKLRIIG